MLIDMGQHARRDQHLSLRKILPALSSVLRETDVTGWYKEDSVIGVLFTEITFDGNGSIPSTVTDRVSGVLKKHLTPREFHEIGLSFYFMPTPQDGEATRRELIPGFYSTLPIPTPTETAL